MFSGATSVSLEYRVQTDPTVILTQLKYPESPLCLKKGTESAPK